MKLTFKIITFILFTLAVSTFLAIQNSNKVVQSEAFEFMEGKWKVEAKIRNSPISYLEGSGTVEAYFSGDTLLADMKIAFTGFNINGLTKRLFNKTTNKWKIDWYPDGGKAEEGIEGQYINDRFIEINYGKDQYDAFIGRLVFYDITADHFSVRKDRIYDDGTMLKETWVYQASRIE